MKDLISREAVYEKRRMLYCFQGGTGCDTLIPCGGVLLSDISDIPSETASMTLKTARNLSEDYVTLFKFNPEVLREREYDLMSYELLHQLRQLNLIRFSEEKIPDGMTEAGNTRYKYVFSAEIMIPYVKDVPDQLDPLNDSFMTCVF